MALSDLMTAVRELNLETEHFWVRPADEAAVRNWHSGWLQDDEVMRFTGIDARRSLAEHLQWLSTFDNKRTLLFTVVDKATGKHVGLVRLYCDPYNARALPTTVLGDRSHWGKARAAELLSAVYEFIFVTLGMNKIHYLVMAANERALRAAANQGRRPVGILRQHEWVEGVGWQDVYVFERLRSEPRTQLSTST